MNKNNIKFTYRFMKYFQFKKDIIQNYHCQMYNYGGDFVTDNFNFICKQNCICDECDMYD